MQKILSTWIKTKRFFQLSLLALWLCSFTGCSNDVEQKQKDLEKYPELKVFFDASGEFESGKANLDTGGVWLNFKPNRNVDSQIFFNDLNAIVVTSGWKANRVSEVQWEYSKTISWAEYSPMIYHVLVTVSVGYVKVDWNRKFSQTQ